MQHEISHCRVAFRWQLARWSYQFRLFLRKGLGERGAGPSCNLAGLMSIIR